MACEQLRSGHGNVVAINVPNGTLLVKIYDGSPADFVKCAKCSFVREGFYRLNCQHHICTYCARFTRSYTCVTDNMTTEIPKPPPVPEIVNATLRQTDVVCPACGLLYLYKSIMNHIQKNHPDLWKEGNEHTWFDNKAPGTSMSTTVPIPMDLPPTQKQHETTVNESYLIDIAQLHAKIHYLKEENGELKSTVKELRSSEENNRRTIAIYEEELVKATTHRMKVEALLKKQGSKFQVRPVFQHIWKLQPYSAVRKRFLFNYATLSTGVLSVNTPGYKVELMISITGHTCEWRRPWVKDQLCCPMSAMYVAAMFRIHGGEDDDLLPWPFANKIAVLLVNHLDEEKSILLELDLSDANWDCLKKPVRGVPNEVFGFSRVISLLEIENPEEGFLFQDCIVFKFTMQ